MISLKARSAHNGLASYTEEASLQFSNTLPWLSPHQKMYVIYIVDVIVEEWDLELKLDIQIRALHAGMEILKFSQEAWMVPQCSPGMTKPSSASAAPCEYNGEDTSVGRFIMQCRIYLQYLTCPQPPELVKVLFMKNFLWGKVLEWVELIFLYRAQEARTVEGFLRLLTARFATTTPNLASLVTPLSATQSVSASRVENTTQPVAISSVVVVAQPDPAPGARETSRPDPAPASGMREPTKPDPAPGAKDDPAWSDPGPSARDTTTWPAPVPGTRDEATAWPALVPGARDAARPGPGAVPGARDAVCHEPVPGARETARPDPVPVLYADDAAWPDPAPAQEALFVLNLFLA
ncbi:hypothetical protein P4O66_010986 [Electrophorus voltai]|uniref:Uncharacterized protein n=1 Tax=Electrophorus voltai TaxID=2609070 RepID=A0AAD8Z7L2_9TELE|nr:hypothetical protein P4O66_010986 [Electrophorus voltai]